MLQTNNYAPIVVFCFKRVESLKKLVEALLSNPESKYSKIYFYSDAPRSNADFEQVRAVRSYLRDVSGFKSVVIVERDSNFGLARSFISGISEILSNNENGIFLEDDNFVSSAFLNFMNSSLEKFKTEPRVGCITGFSFPLLFPVKKGYFLDGAETWSMATWKHVWDKFQVNTEILIELYEDKKMQQRLNKYGFNFYEMLHQQKNGEIDSWGVRWWASAVAQDLLCFYPPKPYCINEGWGVEGTHVTERNPIMSKSKYLSECHDVVYPRKIQSTWLITLNMRAMNLKIQYLGLFQAVIHRIRNQV